MTGTVIFFFLKSESEFDVWGPPTCIYCYKNIFKKVIKRFGNQFLNRIYLPIVQQELAGGGSPVKN